MSRRHEANIRKAAQVGSDPERKTMHNQKALFESTRDRGNRDESLVSMADKLKERRLLVPPFQRSYIWPEQKLIEWIQTVLNRQAIGILVTYQINGEGPEWLADGFQRLTSTSMFLDNPERYGFSINKEDARLDCEKYQISVQHRHYKNHDDAMIAFQHLNRGTPVTPAEYHKGEMTISSIGDYAYKAIQSSLDKIETSLRSRQSLGRNPESKLARDSLGLFFQYISEFKGKDFWAVGKINQKEKPIEKILLEYIKGWNEKDVDDKIKDFESFMFGEVALFRKAMREAQCEGIAISHSALRFLFHLSLWRKNNNLPRNLHVDFIRGFLSLPRSTKTISSRVIFPDDPLKGVTLDMDSLGQLKTICEHIKCDLYSPEKRNNKKTAAIGYNDSHIEPFAIFGNGKTIIEPAPINIARGARSI